MTEKDKNKSLYLLLLLGGVGFMVYKKLKANSDRKPKVDVGPLDELDAWDSSEYTEQRGKSYVVSNLYMNRDPEFMEYVRHLQQKLNIVLKEMNATDFPYFPLAVDGLLGYKTALAIARVFGKGKMPINSLEQIKNLLNNYQ